MPLLARKKIILAKTESTYGTDPTPTGVANAILVRNLNLTPQDADLVNRDLVRPYLGRSEQLPAGIQRLHLAVADGGDGDEDQIVLCLEIQRADDFILNLDIPLILGDQGGEGREVQIGCPE